MFTPRSSAVSNAAMVVALAAVAVVGGWLMTSSLQQDFAAYWVAGAARGKGLDPYLNHVGLAGDGGLWDGTAVYRHSRFLYPPLAAELFRPLAALPYLAAKALFSVAAIGAWCLVSMLAVRWLGSSQRQLGPAFLAGALFFPLYLHLERGQVDIFLLLLLLVAWRMNHRPSIAGAALSVVFLFKPAAAGILPFLAVMRQWRWLAATFCWSAALAAVTVAVSGAELAREYLLEVLPRVARYGEGGTAAMLLPEERLAAVVPSLESGLCEIDGRTYRQQIWQVSAAASLPRLLAPEEPSRAAFTIPYLALATALGALGWRRSGSPPTEDAALAWLYFSALLLCIVASPTGWAMSLVWALPLVPLVLRTGSGMSRGPLVMVVGGLTLCALPALLPGHYVLGLLLLLAGSGASLLAWRRGPTTT
jgi:hypothetical protein